MRQGACAVVAHCTWAADAAARPAILRIGKDGLAQIAAHRRGRERAYACPVRAKTTRAAVDAAASAVLPSPVWVHADRATLALAAQAARSAVEAHASTSAVHTTIDALAALPGDASTVHAQGTKRTGVAARAAVLVAVGQMRAGAAAVAPTLTLAFAGLALAP